ncbi:MAG: hypothetical protein WDN26_02855 [Chitinophagaceae bacterium]
MIRVNTKTGEYVERVKEIKPANKKSPKLNDFGLFCIDL